MFDKCPPVVLLDYIMNPDGVALILAIKGATGKKILKLATYFLYFLAKQLTKVWSLYLKAEDKTLVF